MRAEEKNYSAIELAQKNDNSVAKGSNSDPTSEEHTNGSILEITEEQNGGIVAMIVHDTLSIQIEGNPTTGFIWEPENLNKNLLELVGDPKFTPNSHLKGGNGIFTFKFKALKAGVTHLRLIYHRSFEKDTPTERIFDVILDIQ
jgi:inhibitor of cysteine peptidase